MVKLKDLLELFDEKENVCIITGIDCDRTKSFIVKNIIYQGCCDFWKIEPAVPNFVLNMEVETIIPFEDHADGITWIDIYLKRAED